MPVIIAGRRKGAKLSVPEGMGVRPTLVRVREALFSILYSEFGPLAGARVLDPFAGAGLLGLEAWSRGAEHIDLMEMNAHDLITKTVDRGNLGIMDQSRLPHQMHISLNYAPTAPFALDSGNRRAIGPLSATPNTTSSCAIPPTPTISCRLSYKHSSNKTDSTPEPSSRSNSAPKTPSRHPRHSPSSKNAPTGAAKSSCSSSQARLRARIPPAGRESAKRR